MTSAPDVAVPARPAVQLAGRLSVEVAFYGLFFLLALLTRFWDLGARAVHHDESLHTQFSWMLAVGRGYIHDPLMHGPFLFHANALVYLLFGANDATSRVVPALTGSLLVLAPWLLRHQIGRWGALFSSLLLLVSPAILYYSRFIRHDIYTATASFLLFVAIVRYIEDRRPRWVIMGAAAMAWSVTNHEITYAVLFIFATFVGAVIVWRLSPRLGALAGAAGVIMGATALLAPRLFGWPPLPEIPWQTPTQAAIATYLIALLTHPLIVALAVEIIVAIVAAMVVLRLLVLERRRVAGQPGWLNNLLGPYAPGSTPHALHVLLLDRRTLATAFIVAFTIFATLYTTLFTNLPGLLSGTVGAIGYWLGQQDVRRGEQPWFYYLILMPQYEIIAFFIGGVMAVLTGIRVVLFWLGRRVGSHRLYTLALLSYWAVMIFAILSWAGEKMPWLVIHASVPFTVLAGALLGEVTERLTSKRPSLDAGGMVWSARYRGLTTSIYAGLMLVIAALFFIGANAASTAEPARPLPVPMLLVGMALATAAFGLIAGLRRAGLTAVLVIAGLLVLVQLRIGWIASFQHGDVAKEQLIYVQTSPDVTRVMAEITELSEELTGGKHIGVIYDGGDGGVAWPFEWYLRDFTNRRFMPNGPTSDPGPDIPIVILGAANRPLAEPFLTEYEPVEYVLRWWYPEEDTYRPFAIAPELPPGRSAWRDESQPRDLLAVIGSVIESVAAQGDPAEQARLWRYLMHREPYAPLGSTNFVLYVRKDILRYYNALRY